MDNDYQVVLEEIRELIRHQDVVMFRFASVPKRLLLDGRFSERDGPLIKLVERASSTQERFRELKRLRPRFSLPDRLTVVAWPKFIETFVATGVWGEIEGRIAASRHSGAMHEAAAVLQQLRSLERAEVQHAIRGDGYRSYWERRG